MNAGRPTCPTCSAPDRSALAVCRKPDCLRAANDAERALDLRIEASES